MRNHNISESDEEKKYLCLQADRELLVGERRKKDKGKYISEQQTQMWRGFHGVTMGMPTGSFIEKL